MTDDTIPKPSRLVSAVGLRDARRYPALEPWSATDCSPYWLREDPFHDGWLWDATPSFSARYRVERQLVEEQWRPVPVPDFDDPTSKHGKSLWSRCLNSEHIHRVLALLNGFQHATSRQLHAADQFQIRKSHEYLKALFDLGIVQRGTFTLQRPMPGRKPLMYALNDDLPLRRLLNRLDDDLAYRILGNRERQVFTAGRHVRHDILAFELALRVMETQPNIVAVTGVTGASPAALFPGGENMPDFAADLVLHRIDGLRIAVELAAARNTRHLTNTVRKWTRLLASMSAHESGLAVVIVNAQARRHAQMASDLRRILAGQTRAGVLTHLNGSPVREYEAVRARTQVHLASWLDWFPSGQTISEAGRGLFTAATLDGDRWAAQSLTDPKSHPYDPPGGRPWPTPTPDTSLVVPPWTGVPPLNRPEDIKHRPRKDKPAPFSGASRPRRRPTLKKPAENREGLPGWAIE